MSLAGSSRSWQVSDGMKRLGVVLILVLAFFGIADSAYITQSEAAGNPLICEVESLSDCNLVTSSEYAYLLGVPIAQFGMIFYGVLFALAALELLLFDEFVRRVLFWLSLAGVAVSVYLFLVQVFAIQAYCIYCIASMLISLGIAALASFIHITQRSTILLTPPPASPPLLMPPAQ